MKHKIITIFLISSFAFSLFACGSNSTSSSGDASSDALESSDATSYDETEGETVTYDITEDAAGDGDFYIKLLGLQEYDGFEGEKYTDTPSEGCKYLVLYLDLINYGEDSDYINPAYFTAEVDGESIESTYLLNDPEGYEAAFTTIDSETEIYGYVVFEVPEDWESFSFTYSGWEDTNGAVISSSFTKDDLSDPAEIE